VGVAGVKLPLDLFPNVVGELEIWFADVAADHPTAARFGLPDCRSDREGVFGVDQPHAVSKERHEVLLRDCRRLVVERISTWL
jgi:hypothetical protein